MCAAHKKVVAEKKKALEDRRCKNLLLLQHLYVMKEKPQNERIEKESSENSFRSPKSKKSVSARININDINMPLPSKLISSKNKIAQEREELQASNSISMTSLPLQGALGQQSYRVKKVGAKRTKLIVPSVVKEADTHTDNKD